MFSPELFEVHLWNAGAVDPYGVHHEFKSGLHGQKIDFDEMHVPPGSKLYEDWINLNAQEIDQEYLSSKPKAPLLLLGVAEGTNKPAVDVADKMPYTIGFPTEKDEAKNIHLTRTAKKAIELIRPSLVVILEDVGTTGGSSAQVAKAALEAGAQNAVVQITWQRREHLEKLEEASIPYTSLIKTFLPTYTSEECLDHGFCSDDWQFIPR